MDDGVEEGVVEDGVRAVGGSAIVGDFGGARRDDDDEQKKRETKHPRESGQHRLAGALVGPRAAAQ